MVGRDQRIDFASAGTPNLPPASCACDCSCHLLARCRAHDVTLCETFAHNADPDGSAWQDTLYALAVDVGAPLLWASSPVKLVVCQGRVELPPRTSLRYL